MKMEKPYVIGVDMGGTNTAFGIVDAHGNVISKGVIKTDNPDIDAYVQELKKSAASSLTLWAE